MESEILNRKKKMLLIAPIFFTPLLCLLFWAMGGGHPKGKDVATGKKPGINMDIPKSTNDQVLQKDQAYRKLIEDSLNKLRQTQNDNYLYSNNRVNAPTSIPYSSNSGNVRLPDNYMPSNNGNLIRTGPPPSDVPKSYEELKAKIAKEQTLYQMQQDKNAGVNSSNSAQQQELLQKKAEFDALIAQARAKVNRANQSAVPSAAPPDQAPVGKSELKRDSGIYTLLPNTDEQTDNRFYGETINKKNSSKMPNTIGCVVADDQTVISGAVVKMRLTEDTKLSSGVMVPQNTFLYGIAQLQSERMGLYINNIAYQGSIYPVRLVVYDLDGLPGVRIPGGVDQAAANQGKASIANATLSPASGLFINQSSNPAAQVVAQASSAILQAGQTILARKITIPKVFLKADYRILLKQSQ